LGSDRYVVFDVDGTLTASTGVDDACLLDAWWRVFGAEDVDTDWSKYTHSTDQGLTLEVCQRAHGRVPHADEVAKVKQAFFGLLRELIGLEPGMCPAVPGVNELLSALEHAGWRIGIASGAWEESARIKLGAAGVRADHLPGTFSHARPDGEPARREEIVAATLRKLGNGTIKSGELDLRRAVYVGDGVWDVRAARALGMGFVGVRVDGNTARMTHEGVSSIVRDYRDLDRVLAMLDSALEGR